MTTKKPPKTRVNSLPLLRENAGGIDIGASEIAVAVPPGRQPQTVRLFETFTEDLHDLAAWLRECRVDTVAMESTGVYWIPLFQILEDLGIEVFLVNARSVRTVPGRKSDIRDCQWLQQLHSVGLLNASYRPAHAVCAVRTILRHRQELIRMSSTQIHRMQKSMSQMNLQLHHVISKISGVSGLAIIDAILAGERDPQVLASLCNYRIRASKDTIAKSLVGDYRSEHLFTLRQCLELYRELQRKVHECDVEIERLLERFESAFPVDTPTGTSAEEKLEAEFKRIYGVNLAKVPGLGIETLQTIFGEVGPDFSKFRSQSAFASWMTLCPNNKISGGKILFSQTKLRGSRVATALRVAAHTLQKSKSALGNFFRRIKARLGPAKATTATAHKLARIIFQLVTTGHEYDESQFAETQARHQKRQEAKLRARARNLGFQLVPLSA
jgi:transposase